MPKIAVCIKQIPLVEDANFDPVSRTIRRDGVNVISAYDLRAIAQAVDLKTRLGFETVVVADACRGIDVDGSVAATHKALAEIGAMVIASDEIA